MTFYSHFRHRCPQILQKYGVQALDGHQYITKADKLPAVIDTWQHEWEISPPTSLRLIKQVLLDWTTSYHANRRTKNILTRIRIGHTILSRSYRFKTDYLHLYVRSTLPDWMFPTF